MLEFQDMIHYSPRYNDDTHEYRHVMLPKNMLKVIPQDYFNPETGTLRILLEEEWRGLGITQSLGWVHYETHAPELIYCYLKDQSTTDNRASRERILTSRSMLVYVSSVFE